MFKNIRIKIAALLGVTMMLAPVAIPALASAQNINQGLCAGATLDLNTQGNCNSTTSNGTGKVNGIIHSIINIFSLVVGVVSVIMIIVGGFRYITSGGDSNNISGAKNTIIYAIIGLVVVALAQFIVQFVLNRVTN